MSARVRHRAGWETPSNCCWQDRGRNWWSAKAVAGCMGKHNHSEIHAPELPRSMSTGVRVLRYNDGMEQEGPARCKNFREARNVDNKLDIEARGRMRGSAGGVKHNQEELNKDVMCGDAMKRERGKGYTQILLSAHPRRVSRMPRNASNPVCDWVSDPEDKRALLGFFQSIQSRIGEGGNWDAQCLQDAEVFGIARASSQGSSEDCCLY
ncbi:hypothetical protein C8R44DRAFT_946357 [Mycena epipterygia]|nr:hypothetical protein C8R44DRAFT_946357 [Mycena epipterygia]